MNLYLDSEEVSERIAIAHKMDNVYDLAERLVAKNVPTDEETVLLFLTDEIGMNSVWSLANSTRELDLLLADVLEAMDELRVDEVLGDLDSLYAADFEYLAYGRPDAY